MNKGKLKIIRWSDLEKTNSHLYGKRVFRKANLKKLFILITLILILPINFLENITAQTKLVGIPENSVEIISFDWFLGRDWNITNEFLNNSWKNFNIGKGQRDFQSILEENRKFLANQKEGFIYQLKVRNDSQKIISGIDWEYEFLNPLTGDLLAQHQFSSLEKIKPRQTGDLYIFSKKPPTDIISVELLERNPKNPYLENAAIRSVKFENK